MTDDADTPSFRKINNDHNDDALNSNFLRSVCRLCANICDNVVPIFDDSIAEASICTKLKRCLPSITVSENDMKPKHICLPCVSKLDSCVSFVDMFCEADSKFDVLLQKKGVNEFLINGKTLSPNHEISFIPLKLEPEVSWIPLKQESEAVTKYNFNKCKDQIDIPNVELFNQLCQQRTFSQQIVNTLGPSVSLSTTQNHFSNLTQDGVSHSILQNLLTQDTASPQDVVVLVEVKCKDMTNASSNSVMNKKTDLLQNSMILPVKTTPAATTPTISNQQTRIVDTNGHIRIINLSDFEGKFNQFDKISSSLISDNVVSMEKAYGTNNGISPFLKTFESDILNMLKLDSSGSDSRLASSLDASKILFKSASTTTVATSATPTSVTNGVKHVNTFACEVCGKQFTRRSRLNAHVARHSSERPHLCDKCDQRFITRWDLTLHLRIHSGVFSCEFCGKAFPAKGKLERHRRTHTGERPFVCMLCSRAFSEKRNLRNHLKTHTATIIANGSRTSNTNGIV